MPSEIPPGAAAPGTNRLSPERIERARQTIDPVFLDSPQFEAHALQARLGCRVVVKVETVNPIRSFKARGAHFFVSQLSGRPHLVCATAGNFGQGMAYAARRYDLKLTVFTSADASPLKIERMRSLGAEVRLEKGDFDAASVAAGVFAEECGALLVKDGRDLAVSEGAGTIGVELLRWPERFDSVLVPLGDGALLAGIGTWIKARAPATRVIGICAAGTPAMYQSWRAGRVQLLPGTRTIADGISVQTPVAESLADITLVVDDILLVEDDAMISAMRLAHRELGLVLEPSGAIGIAALLTNTKLFQGQRVATVLTGSNLTADEMRQWLAD